MAGIKIRKSRIIEADLDEILHQADIFPGWEESPFWERERYVAEEKGTVVGSYILDKKSRKTGEIVNINVIPERRKRGIGRLLLAHAIRTAREKGFKILLAGVANSDIGWFAFYQREGFNLGKIEQGYFLKKCKELVYENEILRRDMIRLKFDLEL